MFSKPSTHGITSKLQFYFSTPFSVLAVFLPGMSGFVDIQSGSDFGYPSILMKKERPSIDVLSNIICPTWKLRVTSWNFAVSKVKASVKVSIIFKDLLNENKDVGLNEL